MCGSRGGDRGSGPPLKNHKNIGFLSNTGLDPLKITNLPSQQSMLGHHRHASETPFKWRFAGGPMMARFIYWYLDPLCPHQLKRNKNKRSQNWTPSEKTFWIRAWCSISVKMIEAKGVHMYKGVKQFWFHRDYFFHFHRIFKNWG